MGLGKEGANVVAVAGVDGDDNRTEGNDEGEADPCSVLSAAARTREIKQAVTQPRLVAFSDVVGAS